MPLKSSPFVGFEDSRKGAVVYRTSGRIRAKSYGLST
jgi:hypothetical protein